MDSSVSLEDRISFLRVCHHVPFSLLQTGTVACSMWRWHAVFLRIHKHVHLWLIVLGLQFQFFSGHYCDCLWLEPRHLYYNVCDERISLLGTGHSANGAVWAQPKHWTSVGLFFLTGMLAACSFNSLLLSALCRVRWQYGLRAAWGSRGPTCAFRDDFW